MDKGFHIPPAALAPADVVYRFLDGDVPAGDAQILKDYAQHSLLVLLVQDEKGFGIAHHMAVLFQQPYAEAVKGGDPSQILVRQLGPDPLFHLGSGFIGKGDTENIGSGDAQGIHQIQISGRQCFCFSGACASHHPNVSFRGCGRLPLLWVQLL